MPISKIMVTIVLLFSLTGVAEEVPKVNFVFKDAELHQVIEVISKLTQKTFEIDPALRGKITIVAPQNVTVDEAYNLFSAGLATNGLAIVQSGAHFRILQARNAVKAGLPVYTEIPDSQPERMVTYVYKPKFVSTSDLNKYLGRSASASGNIDVMEPKGTIFISDFISNVIHIKKVFDIVDVETPAAPQPKKK